MTLTECGLSSKNIVNVAKTPQDEKKRKYRYRYLIRNGSWTPWSYIYTSQKEMARMADTYDRTRYQKFEFKACWF